MVEFQTLNKFMSCSETCGDFTSDLREKEKMEGRKKERTESEKERGNTERKKHG